LPLAVFRFTARSLPRERTRLACSVRKASIGSNPRWTAAVFPQQIRPRYLRKTANSLPISRRSTRGQKMASSLQPLEFSLSFESKLRTIARLTVLLALLLPLAVPAEDWPQFRGPNRDSVWNETGTIESF